jgi:hypothetical protein
MSVCLSVCQIVLSVRLAANSLQHSYDAANAATSISPHEHDAAGYDSQISSRNKGFNLSA